MADKKYYNDRDCGRVYYVEPNTIHSVEAVSESQMENYELIPPLEDYSIYVNLEVQVRGRTIRVNGGSEMATYVMSWENRGSGTTVNFMGGSKIPLGDNGSDGYMNSLTTNYTDIFITDINRKTNDRMVNDPTTEMFGISSIDISYANYVVPEVTIDFVDVRGVSLFAQEEAAHNSEGYADTTVEGSFFKSFFSFPYPKFTLYVKGFYGEPVSYELTCSDFRAKFDSKTGNFGAVAKFVGYAFSFLGDISLTSILAAPYSDFLGSEYWDSKVASGEFSVIDENGNKAPMFKLGDIVTRVKRVTENADSLGKNSPAVEEKKYIENRRDILNNIGNLYTRFSQTLKAAATKFTSLPNCDSVIASTPIEGNEDIRAAVFMGMSNSFSGQVFSASALDTTGVIQKDYDNLKEAIKSYNDKYNANLPIPFDISKATPDRIFNNTNKKELLFNKNFSEKLDRMKAYHLKNALNIFRNSSNTRKNIWGNGEGIDGYLYLSSTSDDDFLMALGKERQNNVDALVQNERDINDAVDKAVSDELEFPPTVENFTRIMIAHFETFAYCVFKTAQIICSDNSKRTIESLGLGNGDVRDIKESEAIVPPFPKVTRNVTEMGETKREDSWVGDYTGDFREKDLIHGLLNGVAEFSKAEQENSEGIRTNGSTGATTSYIPTPIAPSDFVITKPVYTDMGGFVNNDELAAQLAIRAFNLLGLNNLALQDLGRAEAENFVNQFPTPSGTLSAVLTDQNIADSLYNILIGADNAKHKWGKSFLEVNGNTLKLRNFSISNCTAVPLQEISSSMKALVGGKIADTVYNKDNWYITSNQALGQSYHCDNVLFIDRNPVRFSEIINKQLSGVETYKNSLRGLYENGILDEDRTIIADFFDGKEEPKRIYGLFENDKSFESTEGSCIFPLKKGEGSKLAFKGNSSTYKSFIDGSINGNKRNKNAFKEKFLPQLIADEVSITSFYGVKIENNLVDGYVDYESLFGQRVYYTATDLRDRAFMFLSSCKGFYDIDGIIKNKLFSTNTSDSILILPHVAVLYAGAECWKYGEFAYKDDNFELREDYKKILVRHFEEWVNTTYIKIDNSLSIVNSVEEYDEINTQRSFVDYKEGSFNGKGVVKHFDDLCGESFFSNYMSVSEQPTKSGFALLNRPSGLGVIDATREILSFCSVVKPMKYMQNAGQVTITVSEFKNFLKCFTDKARELYSSTTEETIESNQVNQAKVPEQDEKNIKLALYSYCKLIHDKWLSGLSQDEFNLEWSFKRFFEGMGSEAYGQVFYFVDSFYSKANDILINIGDACEKLMSAWQTNDTYTLMSYMADVYAYNNLQFFCIHNFIDLSDKESMQNMFKPVPVLEMKEPKKIPNFVIMYAGEPSSHLDGEDRNGYKNDSYLLSIEDGKGGNEWPKALLSTRVGLEGYTLPAFGVSYGKMYQSYFQDIDVGMDNPIVTEQSLKAQYHIASKNNEGEQTSDRRAITLGQDLYTVYANNSYTCTVKMLGCAWVQPLMYFCLNNVPLFRGTYLIQKVSHHIEVGKMMTTFTGVRMSNVRTKRLDNWLYRRKAMNGGATNQSYDGVTVENRAADYTNDCPYKAYPILSEGPGGNYGEPDFSTRLSGLVRDAVGNKLSGNWLNRPLKDSLAAMIVAESDHTDISINVIAAITYNRYRAIGNWSFVLSKQFSSWFDGNAERIFANKTKYDESVRALTNIFTNGSAGVLSGTKYSIPEGWDLNKNKNNKYGLKNGVNTIKPEFAAQMWLNAFKKEWDNTYSNAYNYIRNPNCPLLGVFGTEIPQAICAEPTYAKKLKVEHSPKALNDNSNKISPFAMGFYNALRQTSMNSSVNAEFGVSKEKSNDMTLYIVNGKNDKNFAGVFDIIMNTDEYFKHVKKLMWVTSENNLNNAPNALVVELTEQDYADGRNIGFSFDSGSTISNSKVEYVKDNINDVFPSAIVKHYNNANEASTEVPCISNMDELFSAKTIQACNDVVDTIPLGDLRGYAGNVTNEKMKKVLAKVDYLCHAHGNARNDVNNWYRVRGGNGKDRPDAKTSWCTYGPSTWYGEAGYDLQFWSENDKYLGPSGTTFAKSSAQTASYGFKLVWHSNATPEAKSYLNDKSHLRPGDLAVMFVGNPSSAHACMWTGSDWRSDFKQNNCWIYGNRPGRGDDGYHIALWRHPEFQEPGLT